MELLFLGILILLMALALTSGFPVAFSLPGSAILSIGLAAGCGYIFAGDISAYFAQDGPVEWLTAGVTNFRSLYWDVERDTLIAIPLFVFMGIMLQRSRIAEDLLVTMAQLFGPVPGGLGISVVFVGALLAATTGIVGATVIAMGLISLPAMLRHNYSKSLATGTICAAGTLGQIIPPSVVLIILADQLSNASDIAATARKAEYKEATGEFMLPSVFDVTSTSAGDMFMGAFFPGLVLVALYMIYILVYALIKPEVAPPVHYEGKIDVKFLVRVLTALVPPLTLIFVVLGSIVLGIATVNQAGAIGAIGAMIMGGYRLVEGKKNAYFPAILAVVSTGIIMVVLSFYDLNIKNIRDSGDVFGLVVASLAVTGLLIAVFWSTWRAYTVDNTLQGVMIETAKTTSMVFIILIGAAMLTSAFRGFGGEELVKDFLTGMPGGFWIQFIVVMGVIFLLGFFLDFIEIAVVVVPIVAPILLANPSANVTAVWLGVMIGVNMQTSFLTPPFGFSLFYLRGVAPPTVKTLHIYQGAVAFIILQLVGLAVAGYYPALVNYLPNRIHLTAETAPPPMNPRLQQCLEEFIFDYYDSEEQQLRLSVDRASKLNTGYLPEKYRKSLSQTHEGVLSTFSLVEQVRQAEAAVLAYEPGYRPIHFHVRKLQKEMRDVDEKIEELKKERNRMKRAGHATPEVLERIGGKIAVLEKQKSELESEIPSDWKKQREGYTSLTKNEKKARFAYRNNADSAYEALADLRRVISHTDQLAAMEERIRGLEQVISNEPPAQAMASIKTVGKSLGSIAGASKIKSMLSKARRALKGKKPNVEKSRQMLQEGMNRFNEELAWRQRAVRELAAGLEEYDDTLKASIGLRLQKRMTDEQALYVASCRSDHQDISLHF